MKRTTLLLCLCTAYACGMPKYSTYVQPHTAEMLPNGKPELRPVGPRKLLNTSYKFNDTIQVIIVEKRRKHT